MTAKKPTPAKATATKKAAAPKPTSKACAHRLCKEAPDSRRGFCRKHYRADLAARKAKGAK